MSGRALAGLALADFRERSRRTGYALTLVAAVVLGYVALPPASSVWVIMNAGGYRGVYNSAYTATATALAGALWLMLGGFYVVRSAIDRDERTGVGQVLAATPLTRIGYLAGKFLSNVLVLASMAGVLAVTAVALQVARGESRAVHLITTPAPYLLLTLPVLVVTAAAALLFETLPGLRGGVGNIAWFFVWMICAIAGGGLPLGGLGAVSASMRAAMAAQHLPAAGEFSVGFTKVDRPLTAFEWAGLSPSGGFVTGRILLVLVAVGLAGLPALWITRFDTARRDLRDAAAPVVQPVPAATPRIMAYRPLRPMTASGRPAFTQLCASELRILTQGVSRWWWLVAAAITVAALAVPADLARPTGASTALLLSAAWFWPVLVWSRLATQRRENGLDTLLDAYPGAYRQLAAEWLAGLALTALVGIGPLVRTVVAGDGAQTASWLAGAVFIPSLATLLGTAARTHRAFQLVYIIVWYAVVNQVAAADFMGTVLRTDGRPAGPSPAAVAATAAAMLTVTLGVRAARHRTR